MLGPSCHIIETISPLRFFGGVSAHSNGPALLTSHPPDREPRVLPFALKQPDQSPVHLRWCWHDLQAAVERKPADSPVNTLTVEEIARRNLINQSHASKALLTHLCKQPTSTIAPQTFEYLQENPGMVATLLSLQAEHRIPARYKDLPPYQLGRDLVFLSQAIGLISGLQRTLTKDTDTDDLILKNTRVAIVEDNFAREEFIRIFDLALGNNAPPSPLPVPNTVKHIGMIACLTKQGELDDFMTTVKELDETLAIFGRKDMHLTVCDDSPEHMTAALRERLAGLGSRAGLTIRVISRTEKATMVHALCQKLYDGQNASSKNFTLEQITEALNELLLKRGPAANRNFSMLFLDKPGFQCEEDQVPATLFFSPKAIDRFFYQPFLQTQENKPLRIPGAPSGNAMLSCEPEDVVTIPLAPFLSFEQQPAGIVCALPFSGCADLAIRHIVTHSRQPQASAFGLSTAMDPETYRELYRNITIFTDVPHTTSKFSSAVFLPAGQESHDKTRYFLQPPARDADLITAEVFYQLGVSTIMLGTSVVHKRPAGSVWGRPRLLFDTIVSDVVWNYLRNATPGQTCQSRFETVLADLNKNRSYKFDEALNSALYNTLNVVRGFVVNWNSGRKDLMHFLARLGGTPQEQTDVLLKWFFGLTKGHYDFQQQEEALKHQAAALISNEALMAKIKKDLIEAIRILDTEMAEMKQRFYWDDCWDDLAGNEWVVASKSECIAKLRTEVEPMAGKALRSFAIGMILWDEILAAKQTMIETHPKTP